MYIIKAVNPFEPWRPFRVCLAILISAAAYPSFAQVPASGGASQASQPIHLPLSSRTAGASVSVQQTTSPGGPNTLNTSVQVGGDFSGSVPEAKPAQAVINLTLADAIRLGLRTNLGVISSNNATVMTKAERLRALAALLPSISMNASDTVAQTNLAAYGFKFQLPPGLNFSIPTVVGPYNFTQIAGALSTSVYDPVARRNWHAEQELERASDLSAKDARELVVMAVVGAYLQTVATAARIDSQRAQVANADAVHHQAEVRKQAGTNARIDVMRTLVELQTQQQRLNSLESDWGTQKLALARSIGLPLDLEINLSDKLSPDIIPIPEPASAIQQALAQRSDLKAVEAQVRAAQFSVDAARAERLPSVTLNGDYGVLGPNPAQTHGVFSVTGAVNVPVWTGGRIKAEVEQAQAGLQQRQAELADQKGRVEQEVRAALIHLRTAVGQLQLADTNREYAAETLREARDRFRLGVANTVEVVQAQEQVAAAEADYVSSLYSLDVARLNLARAAGQAATALPDLLKGNRP